MSPGKIGNFHTSLAVQKQVFGFDVPVDDAFVMGVRPLDFSFADRIAEELQIEQPPCAAPLAFSYRVGEPAATGGRILAIWRRPLTVGDPLPVMPLPLNVECAVSVNLEHTYSRAAVDAYVD